MSKLSMIIPVFNEGALLPSVVNRLERTSFPLEVEFVFVDDGSDDGSREFLKTLENRAHVVVSYQHHNTGKGAAVRKGIELASGDFVVIQDADFEYDPSDIARLLEPLMRDEADVVYGSRFKKSHTQVHRTYHYFVNRFLTFLSNLFSGIYLTDMETCYKVFRKDLLKSMNLKSKRFGIEVELTAYIAKTRARIHELPISYFPRTTLQGKKIGWKDGIAALYHLVRFNYGTTFENAFENLPRKYLPSTVEAHVTGEQTKISI